MSNKIIKYNLIALLAFFIVTVSTVSILYVSYGNSLTDVQNKIDSQSEKLRKNKEAEANITNEMEEVNQRVNSAKQEVDELTSEVVAAHKNVLEATEKLQKEKEKLNKESSNLGLRLRNMYKSGGLAFIDIMLSSESTTELFSNFEMVKYIFKNDKAVVAKLKENYAKLKKNQEAVELMENELKKKQTALAEKESSLRKDYDLLAAKKSDISNENIQLAENIKEMQTEAEAIKAQILKEQEKNIPPTPSTPSNNGSNNTANAGGGYIRPCSGIVTSVFGPRSYEIGGRVVSDFHTGLDIAAPFGTPIYASKAGRVIHAGWKGGGYGNLVMIDHGGGVVTIYAHNSAVNVTYGQYVEQGQVIASMGSTGNSTGSHCHFEIRIYGEYINPSLYV